MRYVLIVMLWFSASAQAEEWTNAMWSGGTASSQGGRAAMLPPGTSATTMTRPRGPETFAVGP